MRWRHRGDKEEERRRRGRDDSNHGKFQTETKNVKESFKIKSLFIIKVLKSLILSLNIFKIKL